MASQMDAQVKERQPPWRQAGEEKRGTTFLVWSRTLSLADPLRPFVLGYGDRTRRP